MKKTNKSSRGSVSIIMAVIVLLVLFITVGYSVLKNGKITRGPGSTNSAGDFFQKSKDVKETIATVSPGPKANFSKEGELLDQRQDSEVERWTFLYEEPGNLALIAELKFNFQSKCDLGQGENVCNTERLPK